MKKQLQLGGALGHEAADKRVEILRRVGEGGSISQAAREAGVSYKAAWQALDTLSNLAGVALVERVVGGAGGGGARLTPAGERLLEVAAELGRARAQALARIAGQKPAAGLSGLGLRISTRNQLPCEVNAVASAEGAVRVTLVLPGGTVLAARITRESAQLLGLRRGVPVVALFKATAVAVTAAMPRKAGNAIGGQIVRGTRAPGGEVALETAGGQRVVGFAAAPLRSGQPAWAALDESGVAIAMPG